MLNKIPTSKNFRKILKSILEDAQKKGEEFIDIKSGDLHRKVGGYPKHNHRMPLCCTVMKNEMKPEDEILKTPPSGYGANLIIRFRLPR